jgi:hypothetical protein
MIPCILLNRQGGAIKRWPGPVTPGLLHVMPLLAATADHGLMHRHIKTRRHTMASFFCGYLISRPRGELLQKARDGQKS